VEGKKLFRVVERLDEDHKVRRGGGTPTSTSRVCKINHCFVFFYFTYIYIYIPQVSNKQLINLIKLVIGVIKVKEIEKVGVTFGGFERLIY
jgi:hypothetical protein